MTDIQTILQQPQTVSIAEIKGRMKNEGTRMKNLPLPLTSNTSANVSGIIKPSATHD